MSRDADIHIASLYDAVGTAYMLGVIAAAVEMTEQNGGSAVPWQLPDGVGHLEALLFSDSMIKRLADSSSKGETSWFDMLLMNVGGVAQSSDVIELRANLMWLAGTCVRWSLGINQRQNPHTQYDLTLWKDVDCLVTQQMHSFDEVSSWLSKIFPSQADPHCQGCGYRRSDIISYHCAKDR